MARFERLKVYNAVFEAGMVPIFYHADLETVKKLADALYAGGSRVLEFTNRGDYAIEVFSGLTKYAAKAYPDLVVGIGSIEDAPTAALFLAHGANFVVAPNFNEEVARLCNRRKIGYVPGCGSVTEIATAEEWGVELIKVFPGKSVGGAEFIKDVLGPRPWSKLMPTGGVSNDEANLRAWFDAGVVCVGMGSKLMPAEKIKAGDFDAISQLTRETLALIRTIRGTQ